MSGESQRVEIQSNLVSDRLVRVVKHLLGPNNAFPEPFPMHSQLSDLGISSLKMVNLMLAVEVEFDITIPQAEITPENFQSLGAIEALVTRSLV
jgi:acyl carrier protein